MIFFIDNAKNEFRNTFPAMLDQDGFMADAYTGDRRDVNMTDFLLTLVCHAYLQTTRYTDHLIVIRVTSPKFSPLFVPEPLVNRRILMLFSFLSSYVYRMLDKEPECAKKWPTSLTVG